MSDTQGKSWCMTLNNYSVLQYENLISWYEFDDVINYGVVGKEKGKENTPHLQCAFTLKSPWRFSRVKEFMDKTLKMKPYIVKSVSVERGREYCKKEGDFKEFNKTKQGSRSDLHTVAEYLKEGGSLREVASEWPVAYIRYHKGLRALTSMLQVAFEGKPRVVWAYGPTGVGKSQDARSRFPGFFRATKGGRFFGAYDGQTGVIWDDFRGDWFKYHYLLNLLDWGPMYIETKGFDVPWCAETIYITSSKSPYEVYENMTEDVGQLIRRIDEIYEYEEGNGGVVIKRK